MQNRYVGDLGDFGKFGLLRALCANSEVGNRSPLSLGVVWYLVPDEGHNSDGKFIQFLEPSAQNQQHFRFCDPALYDALRDIVTSGARNVTSVRNRGVLPLETLYYDIPLSFDQVHGPRNQVRNLRTEFRRGWLQDALHSTAGSDLVFLDPDNGLEVKVGTHEPHGPKYAFFDELLPFSEREQSLVVYHHIGRRGSAVDQIRSRFAQIKERLERTSFALLYHRGSARAFFLIPAQRHADVLASKVDEFLDSPWRRHFELITPQ